MSRLLAALFFWSRIVGSCLGPEKHDAHNSYHYADAGRLYELEMLLNAFAIASRRQP